MSTRSHSLFSRLILAAVVLASVGGVFWIGSQLLEPVSVPPPPAAKGSVQFNPKIDVSKNVVFETLEPLGPTRVEAGELGRPNPFAPVPVALESAVTGTAAVSTSTEPTP